MSDKQGLFSGLSLRRPPAASSGGANGASGVGRSPSETIAHPLLGASTSSTSLVSEDTGDVSTPSVTATTENAPLPYKARQRPNHGSRTPRSSISTPTPGAPDSPGTAAAPSAAAAATTTSTTTTTFAVSSDEAGAASRLQLQSLKAAAQRIGLGNGAMGMGMVDAIFEKGARARADGDWAELLKVLTSGKTVLLLPLSPASSLPMTPQTLRDHIAYLSPPLITAGAPPASVIVTLSGLIGTLQGTSVSFESSIPPDSALLTALKDENQRAAVLSSLRPTQLGTASALSADYPVYTVSGESTSLPFPPLGRGPAPPPDKKAEARRINPFMSLFGSSSSTPRTTGALSPERPSSPGGDTSRVSSPPKSIISLESEQTSDGYTVTAYTLDRHIRFAEVHKMLVKAVRSTVRSELEGLPDRVIDKVLRLVVGAVCPVNGSVDQALLKSHHGLRSSDTDIPLDFSDPAAMGERLQDFMEAVHDDLVRHLKSEAEAAPEDDEKANEQNIEAEAGEGTERVEATVCRLLYNRIFSPRQSDDARHDEALASRIAALNMLDLSLDHLGLVTNPPDEPVKGTIASGLASLVDDIGKELQKLASPQFLTPKDKADVLVSAHKIAVDGLAQLPPIQLRPEGEPYRPGKGGDSDSDSEHRSDGDSAGNRDDVLGTINELAEISSAPAEEVPAKNVDTEDAHTEDAGAQDASAREVPAKDASAEDVSAEIAPEEGAKGATEYSDPENDVSETPTPKKETHDEEPAPAAADEKEPRQATSGADLILPIIIFAVVKSNPAQLASQLLYLRRYRSAICLRGEESYAIVNLTAVVEFLEHVQLSELGLGDEGTKVMSVADLTPIALGEVPAHDADTASIATASSRLRGRVFQVGSELAGSAAGSANKVITGVVDSGISALRGFMSATATATATPEASQTPPPQAPAASNGANSTAAITTTTAPGTQARARGASTFSLASVTAGMAHIASAASTAASGAGRRSRSNTGEFGAQELLEVPAPGRAASHSDGDSDAGEGGSGSGGEAAAAPVERQSRARSIVSVSSMMRDEREAGSSSASARGTSPAGLSGRIASLGARLAPSNAAPLDWPIDAPPSSTPPDKPGFFASLSRQRRSNTLSSAGTATLVKSPSGTALGLADDAPIERFMTCEVGDIRLHEVGTLLRDYRRIAGALARLQAQQPQSQ